MSDVVELVKVQGTTSVNIDVRINETGDLLFSGQDVGEGPREIFGDTDYEYWLKVPSAEKDRLLLALIEKHYAGDKLLISNLKELMNLKKIQCEFHSH